jgi:hypothetical protein
MNGEQFCASAILLISREIGKSIKNKIILMLHHRNLLASTFGIGYIGLNARK